MSDDYRTPKPATTIEHIVERILRDVTELPDRTSPEDWPEAMIVTGESVPSAYVLDATETPGGEPC